MSKQKRSRTVSTSGKAKSGRPKSGHGAIEPAGKIEQAIVQIRGERVILDSDLAELYGVETKRLNEQVKRNIDRFPEDFMFQLSAEEQGALR